MSESRNEYSYESRRNNYSSESRSGNSSESRNSYTRNTYSSESHFENKSNKRDSSNENDTIDKLIDKYKRGDITSSELGDLIKQETSKNGEER